MEKKMAATTKLGEDLDVLDDDSDDVMAGIVDDSNGDIDDNETTSMTFIPTALSPATTPQNTQQNMGFKEPRNEKDIDRLLLMVKYPNADEEEIKEVLKIKATQQQAAATAASRKGQLFRERRQHEDAERWKQQQEREQLKHQQQLKKQMQQQQILSSHESIGKQQDSINNRLKFGENDEEQGHHFNLDKVTVHDTNTKRSPEGTNNEAGSNNDIIWQAAMGDGEPLSFNGNDDKVRSQDFGTSSTGDSTEQEEEIHLDREESQKQEYVPKSFVEQTRKSFNRVFGGASKILGNVLPLAAADGNAPPARDNYIDSTGDTISVNTTNGVDNRSLGSSKISNPISQASAVTYKISNVRSPNPTNINEFDSRLGSDQHPVNHINNNDFVDSNDQESNRKGWRGNKTLQEWILDRKKNKLLIFIFSMIIVVAVVFTTLAAVYGSRRRANMNASESSEISSPSPTSGDSTNDEDFSTTTINPEDNATEVPSLDIDYEDDSEKALSTIATSITTESLLDINDPSSTPTVMPTILPTVSSFFSGIQTSSTLPQNTSPPTSLPTILSASTSTLIEQDFLNWSWSDDAEDGTILKGVPAIDVHFGESVALSADGQTLVVGVPDAFDKLGIVRIYERKSGFWVSTNSLLGRNKGDEFGKAIALSADGRVLAVSEPMYNGSAGDKTGNIRTFVYSPFGYIQMGQDIEGDDATDQLGTGIALSSDGRRLAVGAPYHDNSYDDGVRSGSSDGLDRLVSGTAKVFEWSDEIQEWISIDTISSGTPLIGSTHRDHFGSSIDLNDNGSLLCVGAPRNSGYVQCFGEERIENISSSNSNTRQWKQIGNTIRNEDGILRHDDNFGAFIRVGRDSTGTRHRVAIGAPGKNSGKMLDTGHVVIYEFNPSTAARGWIRLGKKVITSKIPGRDFRMGFSLDMHEDLLAVGIPGANGGIGKIEIFEFQRDSWEWLRNPTIFDGSTTGSSGYGAAISMTPSGNLVVGSPGTNDNVGSVRFYLRMGQGQ